MSPVVGRSRAERAITRPLSPASIIALADRKRAPHKGDSAGLARPVTPSFTGFPSLGPRKASRLFGSFGEGAFLGGPCYGTTDP